MLFGGSIIVEAVLFLMIIMTGLIWKATHEFLREVSGQYSTDKSDGYLIITRVKK